MPKLLRLLAAFTLLAFAMPVESRADGHEVNGIWWNVILNYNNSGEDVCVAEQYNNQALSNVQFDIYPGNLNRPGPPWLHGTATIPLMQPYTFYRVFGWLPTKGAPPPQCTLKNYWLSGKRLKVRRRDVQSSSRLLIH